jgi:hypothetical protein
MRSPFDDLPMRRSSVRVPLVLTGAVAVIALVLTLGGWAPFSAFEPRRGCQALIAGDGHARVSDPVSAAIEMSRVSFPCADAVTVADLADPAAVRTAALHAVGAGGPLLLAEEGLGEEVVAEVTRLEPRTVALVGLDDTDDSALVGIEIDRVSPDPDALRPEVPEVAEGPLILLHDRVSAALPAAEVIAAAAGGKVLLTQEVDLLDLPDPTRLVIDQASALRLVGEFDPSEAWQLEVARSDRTLPGGGRLLVPGRRLVGFYGSPLTGALGVLGEQGPAATAERMEQALAGYDADGVPVVPTFEIIATVAAAAPGPDGDYSDEVSVETLRPWIDYAAANGIYVVLDLQSGRTDFLTQAQRYDELLRQPHVGLALDPEWRLGPDQVHLEQIGTVDAAEINRVSEWLAGIVQAEILPQKVFLLHQFRESMITNRERIVGHPELATIIQMDGQGPLATKLDSWDALTLGWSPETPYTWGWKNFYDEDEPMAMASQVLALDPVPVFISFQ